ncbi:MAG: hypothetical protein IKM79_04995 [Bacteroidales bacterium]|nr:hypothetical protein [Bacteroidales bacterium]
MKKLLFVFAAATLVFFSSCRHDDFDLLKHPVHVQGGANVHLGAPVGNGEMTVDDLFAMINDPTIADLMDSNSTVITLNFETTMDDTVSGGGLNIGAKKVIGGLKVKTLPWGQNKVNRRWTPVRRNNDRKWSPRVTTRVTAAKSGAYNSKDGSGSDYIFNYSDTISRSLSLSMLSNSDFFNNADFELDSVGLSFELDLEALCPENVKHYLNDYISLAIDSLQLFYTDSNGIEHEYTEQYPFDGSMPRNLYGFDAPNHIGIAQQPMVVSFPSINIASVVNSKPTAMKIRFRFTLNVARQLVLDVVARPEFDTTGLYLTGLDLNTIDLNDVSNMDTSTLMGNIRNNLANIDTIPTINYLFFGSEWQSNPAHIDTSNPATVLAFLEIDTQTVLNHFNIDTTKPRTILQAVGFEDTTDAALIHNAIPSAANYVGGEWVIDTCELLSFATNYAIHGCTDTMGMVKEIFSSQALSINGSDTVFDTNFFLSELTNGDITSIDNTSDILEWIGVDTSEGNIRSLLVDAGILNANDTSDEALLRAVFDNHYIGEGAPQSDTNWFIQQASNGVVQGIDDTIGIINAATNGAGVSGGEIDTNYFINLAFPGSITGGNIDTNYFVGLIVGPGTTLDDPQAILQHYNISTDTTDLATYARIPGLSEIPPDTTAAAAYLGLPYYNDRNSLRDYLLANPNDFGQYGYTPAQIAAMATNLSQLEAALEDIENQMRQQIVDTIASHVTRWVEDTITELISNDLANTIEQPLADTIEGRIINWVENTMGDFIEDRVATFIEEELGDYLEELISDTIAARIQANIIPRIEEYVEDQVIPFVTDTITNYYRDTIMNYIVEQVTAYVTEKLETKLNTYLEERIDNFTALKDTLIGIVEQVSQSNFACHAAVGVNIPFQIKIGSLEHPMYVELWKDGQNPIDVDAILAKLPNFINAELDPSYFNMKMTNNMPLEFIVNASMCDANKQPIAGGDIIAGDTIKAAQLVQDPSNPTCYAAGDSTISILRATMDQAKLKKLKDAKYLCLNLKLSTNNQFVYVKRTDKLAFRAYLQANASANVDIAVPHTPLPIPNIF